MEVGSGTGDVILSLASDFRYSVGLDINVGFLAYAEKNTPEHLKHKVRPLFVTMFKKEFGFFEKENKPPTQIFSC